MNSSYSSSGSTVAPQNHQKPMSNSPLIDVVPEDALDVLEGRIDTEGLELLGEVLAHQVLVATNANRRGHSELDLLAVRPQQLVAILRVADALKQLQRFVGVVLQRAPGLLGFLVDVLVEVAVVGPQALRGLGGRRPDVGAPLLAVHQHRHCAAELGLPPGASLASLNHAARGHGST